MKLAQRERVTLNVALTKLTDGYKRVVPLQEIFKLLSQHEIVPLQEDGTPWEGMLCGREGRIALDLSYGGITPITNAALILTWYKMESGKYETVAYVS